MSEINLDRRCFRESGGGERCVSCSNLRREIFNRATRCFEDLRGQSYFWQKEVMAHSQHFARTRPAATHTRLNYHCRPTRHHPTPEGSSAAIHRTQTQDMNGYTHQNSAKYESCDRNPCIVVIKGCKYCPAILGTPTGRGSGVSLDGAGRATFGSCGRPRQ